MAPPVAQGSSAPNPGVAALLGQDLTLRHVSGPFPAPEGCLAVEGGAASDGQNVQTAACDGAEAQTWRLEQRTAGTETGRLRLVSGLQDDQSQSYCLDNRGEFTDSAQMGIWSCVDDTHAAVVNQTFDLGPSGSEGWTLTFTSGDASSVLWAERADDSSSGNVGQRSGGSGARAEWLIDTDRPAPPVALGVLGQAVFSVADASVTEAAGAELAFTVSLDRAVTNGDGAVSVDYATRDGTATAGADYTAATGTLTFAVGDQEQTVRVAVLEDAHDDGGETLELVLSNAVGAAIADGSGTGTIENADPLPQAWLARFGRTAAEHVLDGIRERRAAERAPGERLTLLGESMLSAASAEAMEGPIPSAAWAAAADRFGAHEVGGIHESHVPSGREALIGASFEVTGAEDAAGGAVALWGRGAHTDFAGRDGSLTLDGRMTTGLAGADYGGRGWLAGLVVSQSGASGVYDDASAGALGELESSLTAATVYGAVDALRWLELWGAAGYGLGALTLRPAAESPAKAGLTWTMAAAGARSVLAEPGAGGGPAFALIADGLWARTASAEAAVGSLAAAQADVTRLRLGAEGSWAVTLAGGGALTPVVEAGLRRDDGDAEAGFGVEVGGGVVWSILAVGLSLDFSGRTLVAHENPDVRDWGVSAGLVFDPDPASQRGPSAMLRHEVGGAATGGLAALLAPEPLELRTDAQTVGGWTGEAAWGFPAFGGIFIGSPYAGLGLTDGARDYTIGWRLTPAGSDAPDLSFNLVTTRHESTGAPSEHTIGMEAAIRW